jgi:hypothetical protein
MDWDRFSKDDAIGSLSLQTFELLKITEAGPHWFKLENCKQGELFLLATKQDISQTESNLQQREGLLKQSERILQIVRVNEPFRKFSAEASEENQENQNEDLKEEGWINIPILRLDKLESLHSPGVVITELSDDEFPDNILLQPSESQGTVLTPTTDSEEHVDISNDDKINIKFQDLDIKNLHKSSEDICLIGEIKDIEHGEEIVAGNYGQSSPIVEEVQLTIEPNSGEDKSTKDSNRAEGTLSITDNKKAEEYKKAQSLPFHRPLSTESSTSSDASSVVTVIEVPIRVSLTTTDASKDSVKEKQPIIEIPMIKPRESEPSMVTMMPKSDISEGSSEGKDHVENTIPHKDTSFKNLKWTVNIPIQRISKDLDAGTAIFTNTQNLDSFKPMMETSTVAHESASKEILQEAIHPNEKPNVLSCEDARAGEALVLKSSESMNFGIPMSNTVTEESTSVTERTSNILSSSVSSDTEVATQASEISSSLSESGVSSLAHQAILPTLFEGTEISSIAHQPIPESSSLAHQSNVPSPQSAVASFVGHQVVGPLLELGVSSVSHKVQQTNCQSVILPSFSQDFLRCESSGLGVASVAHNVTLSMPNQECVSFVAHEVGIKAQMQSEISSVVHKITIPTLEHGISSLAHQVVPSSLESGASSVCHSVTESMLSDIFKPGLTGVSSVAHKVVMTHVPGSNSNTSFVSHIVNPPTLSAAGSSSVAHQIIQSLHNVGTSSLNHQILYPASFDRTYSPVTHSVMSNPSEETDDPLITHKFVESSEAKSSLISPQIVQESAPNGSDVNQATMPKPTAEDLQERLECSDVAHAMVSCEDPIGLIAGFDNNAEEEGNILEKILDIKVHEAQKLSQQDVFTKIDPYVIIRCQNVDFKSETKNNTQDPEWNFEANLKVNIGANDVIDILVYDNDCFTKDDLIGKLSLDIDNLWYSDGATQKWESLDAGGEVCYSVKFRDAKLSTVEDLSIMPTLSTRSEDDRENFESTRTSPCETSLGEIKSPLASDKIHKLEIKKLEIVPKENLLSEQTSAGKQTLMEATEKNIAKPELSEISVIYDLDTIKEAEGTLVKVNTTHKEFATGRADPEITKELKNDSPLAFTEDASDKQADATVDTIEEPTSISSSEILSEDTNMVTVQPSPMLDQDNSAEIRTLSSASLKVNGNNCFALLCFSNLFLKISWKNKCYLVKQPMLNTYIPFFEAFRECFHSKK